MAAPAAGEGVRAAEHPRAYLQRGVAPGAASGHLLEGEVVAESAAGEEESDSDGAEGPGGVGREEPDEGGHQEAPALEARGPGQPPGARTLP